MKIFLVICLLIGVVFADTIIEEIEEKSAQDIQQEELETKKRTVKKLTKEEKA